MISVSSLRRRAVEGNPDLADETASIVERDELVALLRVVEAALAWYRSGPESVRYPGPQDEAELGELEAALQPFGLVAAAKP